MKKYLCYWDLNRRGRAIYVPIEEIGMVHLKLQSFFEAAMYYNYWVFHADKKMFYVYEKFGEIYLWTHEWTSIDKFPECVNYEI